MVSKKEAILNLFETKGSEEIFCGQSGGIKQDSGQHRRNSKNIDGPGRKTKKL